jgi:hypothetical protein
LITLYITPVIYTYLDTLQKKAGRIPILRSRSTD